MPRSHVPAGVTHLRVTVTSGRSESAPDDVFILALPLAQPRPPVADDVYLATFARLAVAPAEHDLIRIGRAHGFVAGAPMTEEVTISLRAPWQRSRADLETAVAGVFRATIDQTDSVPVTPIGHDAAIAAGLSLVGDVVPGLRPGDVSIRAEEHVSGAWAVRLRAPGPTDFDVHVGFVDAHPGTIHLRRSSPAEVVDSVGPG